MIIRGYCFISPVKHICRRFQRGLMVVVVVLLLHVHGKQLWSCRESHFFS